VAIRRISHILTVRSRKLPAGIAKVKNTGFEDSVDRSEQLNPTPQEKQLVFSILHKPMVTVSQESFPIVLKKKKKNNHKTTTKKLTVFEKSQGVEIYCHHIYTLLHRQSHTG